MASGVRKRRGQSSFRYSAVATATGTPSSSAIAEVISVPATMGNPWKMLRAGSQSLPKTKLKPKVLKVFPDSWIRRMKK